MAQHHSIQRPGTVSYCFGSLIELMNRLLKVSGEGFELEQQSQLLSGLEHARPRAHLGRDYPLTLAATGALEKSYFERLHRCFHFDLWDVIPDNDINIGSMPQSSEHYLDKDV